MNPIFSFRIARPSKVLAASLAVIFLYSTLSAPLAEANFWQERRSAAKQAAPSFAQSPAALGAGAGNVLPLVTKGLGDWKPADLPGLKRQSKAGVPDWLASLPSAYGDIRGVKTGKSGKTIVLIQDAHDIHSAQLNISRILSHLESSLPAAQSNSKETKPSPLLVGLEGAEGAFALDQWRAADDDQRQQQIIADLMLEKKLITGPEYYAMLAPHAPEYWGVEKGALYVDNVESYLAARPKQEEFKKDIAAMESSLKAAKDKQYSLELWALEENLSAYAKGNLSLLNYVKYLGGQAHSLEKFGQVKKLLEILTLEESLDFSTVEKERMGLIRELTAKLDKNSLNELVRYSMAYRMGNIGYGDYYTMLKEFSGQRGVDLKRYPGFDKYIQYVLKAESIDKYQLFDEVEDLKSAVIERMGKTAVQKDLLKIGEDLRLLGRLSDQEFGPAEWKHYESHRQDMLALPARIAKISQAAGGKTNSGDDAFTALLPIFERFYSAAEKRNQALADNLLGRMDELNTKTGVLVAGGYHTPTLETLLRAKGATVVTVTPKVGQIEKGSKYLDVFAMKQVPLENLFQGEKLYIIRQEGFVLKTMESHIADLDLPGETAREFFIALLGSIRGARAAAASMPRQKNGGDSISVMESSVQVQYDWTVLGGKGKGLIRINVHFPARGETKTVAYVIPVPEDGINFDEAVRNLRSQFERLTSLPAAEIIPATLGENSANDIPMAVLPESFSFAPARGLQLGKLLAHLSAWPRNLWNKWEFGLPLVGLTLLAGVTMTLQVVQGLNPVLLIVEGMFILGVWFAVGGILGGLRVSDNTKKGLLAVVFTIGFFAVLYFLAMAFGFVPNIFPSYLYPSGILSTATTTYSAMGTSGYLAAAPIQTMGLTSSSLLMMRLVGLFATISGVILLVLGYLGRSGDTPKNLSVPVRTDDSREFFVQARALLGLEESVSNEALLRQLGIKNAPSHITFREAAEFGQGDAARKVYRVTMTFADGSTKDWLMLGADGLFEGQIRAFIGVAYENEKLSRAVFNLDGGRYWQTSIDGQKRPLAFHSIPNAQAQYNIVIKSRWWALALLIVSSGVILFGLGLGLQHTFGNLISINLFFMTIFILLVWSYRNDYLKAKGYRGGDRFKQVLLSGLVFLIIFNFSLYLMGWDILSLINIGTNAAGSVAGTYSAMGTGYLAAPQIQSMGLFDIRGVLLAIVFGIVGFIIRLRGDSLRDRLHMPVMMDDDSREFLTQAGTLAGVDGDLLDPELQAQIFMKLGLKAPPKHISFKEAAVIGQGNGALKVYRLTMEFRDGSTKDWLMLGAEELDETQIKSFIGTTYRSLPGLEDGKVFNYDGGKYKQIILGAQNRPLAFHSISNAEHRYGIAAGARNWNPLIAAVIVVAGIVMKGIGPHLYLSSPLVFNFEMVLVIIFAAFLSFNPRMKANGVPSKTRIFRLVLSGLVALAIFNLFLYLMGWDVLGSMATLLSGIIGGPAATGYSSMGTIGSLAAPSGWGTVLLILISYMALLLLIRRGSDALRGLVKSSGPPSAEYQTNLARAESVLGKIFPATVIQSSMATNPSKAQKMLKLDFYNLFGLAIGDLVQLGDPELVSSTDGNKHFLVRMTVRVRDGTGTVTERNVEYEVIVPANFQWELGRLSRHISSRVEGSEGPIQLTAVRSEMPVPIARLLRALVVVVFYSVIVIAVLHFGVSADTTPLAPLDAWAWFLKNTAEVPLLRFVIAFWFIRFVVPGIAAIIRWIWSGRLLPLKTGQSLPKLRADAGKRRWPRLGSIALVLVMVAAGLLLTGTPVYAAGLSSAPSAAAAFPWGWILGGFGIAALILVGALVWYERSLPAKSEMPSLQSPLLKTDGDRKARVLEVFKIIFPLNNADRQSGITAEQIASDFEALFGRPIDSLLRLDDPKPVQGRKAADDWSESVVSMTILDGGTPVDIHWRVRVPLTFVWSPGTLHEQISAWNVSAGEADVPSQVPIATLLHARRYVVSAATLAAAAMALGPAAISLLPEVHAPKSESVPAPLAGFTPLNMPDLYGRVAAQINDQMSPGEAAMNAIAVMEQGNFDIARRIFSDQLSSGRSLASSPEFLFSLVKYRQATGDTRYDGDISRLYQELLKLYPEGTLLASPLNGAPFLIEGDIWAFIVLAAARSLDPTVFRGQVDFERITQTRSQVAGHLADVLDQPKNWEYAGPTLYLFLIALTTYPEEFAGRLDASKLEAIADYALSQMGYTINSERDGLKDVYVSDNETHTQRRVQYENNDGRWLPHPDVKSTAMMMVALGSLTKFLNADAKYREKIEGAIRGQQFLYDVIRYRIEIPGPLPDGDMAVFRSATRGLTGLIDYEPGTIEIAGYGWYSEASGYWVPVLLSLLSYKSNPFHVPVLTQQPAASESAAGGLLVVGAGVAAAVAAILAAQDQETVAEQRRYQARRAQLTVLWSAVSTAVLVAVIALLQLGLNVDVWAWILEQMSFVPVPGFLIPLFVVGGVILFGLWMSGRAIHPPKSGTDGLQMERRELLAIGVIGITAIAQKAAFPGCSKSAPTPTPTPKPSQPGTADNWEWVLGQTGQQPGIYRSYESGSGQNLAVTYDQSLVVREALRRGTSGDIEVARQILDLYARRIQSKAQAQVYERGGYYAPYDSYNPDGSTNEYKVYLGSVFHLLQAYLQYTHATGDKQFLPIIENLVEFTLTFQQTDGRFTGGIEFSGAPAVWTSTEHNISGFVALKMAETVLAGNPITTRLQQSREKVAGWLVSDHGALWRDGKTLKLNRGQGQDGKGDHTQSSDVYSWYVLAVLTYPEDFKQYLTDQNLVDLMWFANDEFRTSLPGDSIGHGSDFMSAKERQASGEAPVISGEWTAWMSVTDFILWDLKAVHPTATDPHADGDMHGFLIWASELSYTVGAMTKSNGSVPYASRAAKTFPDGWNALPYGALSATIGNIWASERYNFFALHDRVQPTAQSTVLPAAWTAQRSRRSLLPLDWVRQVRAVGVVAFVPMFMKGSSQSLGWVGGLVYLAIALAIIIVSIRQGVKWFKKTYSYGLRTLLVAGMLAVPAGLAAIATWGLGLTLALGFVLMFASLSALVLGIGLVILTVEGLGWIWETTTTEVKANIGGVMIVPLTLSMVLALSLPWWVWGLMGVSFLVGILFMIPSIYEVMKDRSPAATTLIGTGALAVAVGISVLIVKLSLPHWLWGLVGLIAIFGTISGGIGAVDLAADAMQKVDEAKERAKNSWWSWFWRGGVTLAALAGVVAYMKWASPQWGLLVVVASFIASMLILLAKSSEPLRDFADRRGLNTRTITIAGVLFYGFLLVLGIAAIILFAGPTSASSTLKILAFFFAATPIAMFIRTIRQPKKKTSTVAIWVILSLLGIFLAWGLVSVASSVPAFYPALIGFLFKLAPAVIMAFSLGFWVNYFWHQKKYEQANPRAKMDAARWGLWISIGLTVLAGIIGFFFGGHVHIASLGAASVAPWLAQALSGKIAFAHFLTANLSSSLNLSLGSNAGPAAMILALGAIATHQLPMILVAFSAVFALLLGIIFGLIIINYLSGRTKRVVPENDLNSPVPSLAEQTAYYQRTRNEILESLEVDQDQPLLDALQIPMVSSNLASQIVGDGLRPGVDDMSRAVGVLGEAARRLSVTADRATIGREVRESVAVAAAYLSTLDNELASKVAEVVLWEIGQATRPDASESRATLKLAELTLQAGNVRVFGRGVLNALERVDLRGTVRTAVRHAVLPPNASQRDLEAMSAEVGTLLTGDKAAERVFVLASKEVAAMLETRYGGYMHSNRQRLFIFNVDAEPGQSINVFDALNGKVDTKLINEIDLIITSAGLPELDLNELYTEVPGLRDRITILIVALSAVFILEGNRTGNIQTQMDALVRALQAA